MENNLPDHSNLPPVVSENKPKLNNSKSLILIGILVFLCSVSLLLALFFSSNKKTVTPLVIQKAVISGTLDLNGPLESNSLITISKRELGTPVFTPVIQDLPAKDGQVWSWNGALQNKNYELLASLYFKGIKIQESDILIVTAPAKDEVLKITIAPKEDSTSSAVISGIFDLNGYLPLNSKISLIETPEGQTTETIISSFLNPIDQGPWSWENAGIKESYLLKAILYDVNNKIIGKSEAIKVTAPAANEVLIITSLAKPAVITPAVGIISGKINLNGTVPDKARLVLLQRVAGTDQYLVALDNLNPGDGVLWNWGGAVSGTSYELLAVLKVKNDNGTDADINHSQSLVVTAPAINELITLNTNVNMSTPGQPSVSCDNQNNNQWNITLKGTRQIDVVSYWFEIGTQSGGNDVNNSIISQSDIDPQLKAIINNNTTYYSRYSYAYCSNCSNSNYSSFSNTLIFTCPQSPTPLPTSAYTGYICDPISGCQATTKANPPYAFNNAGLAQCQLVCNKPTSSPTPTIPPLLPTETPSPTPIPTQPPPPTNAPVPTDIVPTDTPMLPQGD